tara:strand:- start:12489 stop:12848 length:360 start_codon:yes stop_codon:yes gene_type:complete
MTVTYTSKHSSPQDPGGLIWQAVDMGDEFPGPAEDLLLSWTLRLDPSIDSRQAAAFLLDSYGLGARELGDSPCDRLIGLLRETATAAPRRRGGRRGGWRSKRTTEELAAMDPSETSQDD